MSDDGFFVAAFAVPAIELDTSNKKRFDRLLQDGIYVNIPATRKKSLTVHFHRGFATKLSTREISVVGRVDVVMRQWLIHFHVDIESIEPDGSIVVGHEIANETIFAQSSCRLKQTRITPEFLYKLSSTGRAYYF